MLSVNYRLSFSNKIAIRTRRLTYWHRPGRSWVWFSASSNRTQCRKRLVTAETFLCCQGAMPRKWAPPLVARFGCNTTSIMKVWFLIFYRVKTKRYSHSANKLSKEVILFQLTVLTNHPNAADYNWLRKIVFREINQMYHSYNFYLVTWLLASGSYRWF